MALRAASRHILHLKLSLCCCSDSKGIEMTGPCSTWRWSVSACWESASVVRLRRGAVGRSDVVDFEWRKTWAIFYSAALSPPLPSSPARPHSDAVYAPLVLCVVVSGRRKFRGP